MEELSNAPVWFEGLRWFIVAILLAMAAIGPVLLGPIIDKLRNGNKQSNTQDLKVKETSDRSTMMVVGGALADNESILQLVGALHRLCDIMEDRITMEKDESEEAKMRRTIREMLRDLSNIDKGT